MKKKTDAGSEFNETNQDEGEEEEEKDFTKALDCDGHQPKSDHILTVEINNHQIHLKALSGDSLWNCSQFLIIKLKCSIYTGYFRDIIDSLTDCSSHDLDLSQFVLNPVEKATAKYALIAVCNHIRSLSEEHYTTHEKNSIDQKWDTFDDSKVLDVDEDNVISTAAYRLVYQQQQ
ncbi:unnamed protein product [Rotaria sp. Silwood1]|nr:unnamed protein product [Rotaria sp. Silwood1]CAF0951261.1 unnamed protein product [Rotaria sp. Silwood1]CAF3396969.1 unnamed protein product [Rotaria sp. Silwood1]CAF4823529.1 unnamed protein product [Rotaria sp. Silwood1]